MGGNVVAKTRRSSRQTHGKLGVTVTAKSQQNGSLRVAAKSRQTKYVCYREFDASLTRVMPTSSWTIFASNRASNSMILCSDMIVRSIYKKVLVPPLAQFMGCPNQSSRHFGLILTKTLQRVLFNLQNRQQVLQSYLWRRKMAPYASVSTFGV
jgi:hypothetical protein